MNKRDQLHRKWQKDKSPTTKRAYQQIRNIVKKMLRSTKSYYNKELLKENSNDPNKFWSCIKRIFPCKSKSTNHSKPTFTVNGVKTETDLQIANGFCSYLTSIVHKLKAETFKLCDFFWRKQKDIRPKTNKKFKFKHVSKVEIEYQLKKLQRKKATGTDGLPACMIKDVASVISSPLSYIVNLSLKTGTIPAEWKEARVTPIYKSGPKNLFDNYRPISVLSVMSKVLERAIHKQLLSHLESENLLTPSQYGFRPKRSTQLAATALLDNIRRDVDRGNLVGALFIDLSKAFDTLSHSKLLTKLSAYGIVDKELMWFTDYLFGRKITVSYGDYLSNKQSVFTGVPQGSILGPLLFLIYFNDVVDCIQNANIIKYADDTVLFFSGKSLQNIEQNLSEDIDRLADWFEENELILNLKKGKSEVMLFGTPQRISKLKKETLNINYRSRAINVTTEYKYLGVHIDSTLNLNTHFDKVYKKASGKLKLLEKLRYQLDTKSAQAIYNLMIVPTITYCSTLQANLTSTRKKCLQSFVNRASKTIAHNINTKATIIGQHH